MQTKYKFDAENHIHLYDGKPMFGTSTVMGVIAKVLTWWAAGLSVQSLGIPDYKILTKLKNKKATKEEIAELKKGLRSFLRKHKAKLTVDYYLELLDKAYRAHSVKLDESAEEGTELHARLEKYVKRCISIDGAVHAPAPDEFGIEPFYLWAMLNVKRFLWSELHTFSIKHWLGGITDCGVELKNGEIAIIDYKSAKEAYDTHFWQCAGYDIQITENNGGFDAEGNKVFELPRPITQYIVFPFGAKVVEASVSLRVEQGKAVYLAALTIHKEREELKKIKENEE